MYTVPFAGTGGSYVAVHSAHVTLIYRGAPGPGRLAASRSPAGPGCDGYNNIYPGGTWLDPAALGDAIVARWVRPQPC